MVPNKKCQSRISFEDGRITFARHNSRPAPKSSNNSNINLNIQNFSDPNTSEGQGQGLKAEKVKHQQDSI